MRIDIGSICKAFVPLAALAMTASLSGCDSTITVDGTEGKKLSELDLTGEAPTKLVLAGPDHVKITEGAKLAITVEGDANVADKLRFTLTGGTLGILRTKSWKTGGAVTVNVTMPAPQDVTLAGSGTIDAAQLGKDAKVTVAGSGEVHAGTISGDSFELTVAGSGTIRGGGAIKNLDMTIAGSGNATITSDGDVSASIFGSGMVTVKGRATCTVSSMGSGKLVCESGEPTRDDAPDAPDADESNAN